MDDDRSNRTSNPFLGNTLRLVDLFLSLVSFGSDGFDNSIFTHGQLDAATLDLRGETSQVSVLTG